LLGIEDFQKDLHSRCRNGLCQKLAPDRSGSQTHSFHSLLPPSAVVNILSHVDSRVSHVVPRHFGPNANTAHQARVHGTETSEIDCSGQSKLLDSGLEVPIQQIPSAYRASSCVGENQITRISMFGPLPGPIQNTTQDSKGIEWNATATSIGFARGVDLVFEESFQTHPVRLPGCGARASRCGPNTAWVGKR